MHRSMRARLTVAFALGISLFMAFLSSALMAYNRQLGQNQLAERLELLAHQYRSDLLSGRRTPTNWERFLAEERSKVHSQGLTLLVLDNRGDVLGRTRRAGHDWPMNGNWLTETVSYKGDVLILAAPWHSNQQSQKELGRKLAILSVGVVLAAAMGSWLLVGRVLSPIDHLAQQAAQASIHHLRPSLEAPSDDAEVVGLVSTLNGMLASLAQSVEARERFYNAVSHELRTPLQGFSTLLEYGLSRERTPREWHEIASEAHGQSLQLAQLTTDLLVLNQLDMATKAPPSEEVDAADLVDRYLQNLQPQIADRKLVTLVDLPASGEVLAPSNHMAMILRNLLENAVKYAREGGEVRVALTVPSPTEAHFRVWNTADLPADLEVEKLLEPFYRMDEARASTTGGNGLGLAICAAIAANNDWHLRLRRAQGGLLAELDIPAYQG